MNDTLANVLPYRVDLNKPIKKKYLDTLLATGDHEAHRFDIELVRNGEAAIIPSGAGVHGYFIKHSSKEDEEDSMVVLKGSAEGNVASIKLDKACYAKTCQISFIIKVTVGEEITSIFWGDGTVMRSKTDTIEDPTNIVHDLDTLLAQIAAMEAATAEGIAAAEDARSAAQTARDEAASMQGQFDAQKEEVAARQTEHEEAVSAGLSQLKDFKADAIWDTSARAASHELHAQRGPMSVTLHGKTMETGTGDKSPENPYVISGVDVAQVRAGGKNLIKGICHQVNASGLTITENADGSFKIVGTPTTRAILYFFYSALEKVYLPACTYTLSSKNALTQGVNVVLGHYKDNKYAGNLGYLSYLEQTRTYTRSEPSGFLEGYVEVQAGTNVDITIALQLEIGSTATSYEPYCANVINPPLLPDGKPLMGNGAVDDTVENDCASGCDASITFDGSEDEEFTLVTGTAYQIWIPAYDHSNFVMFTNRMPVMTYGILSATQAESGKVGWHATADTIYINDPDCASIAALRAKLAANPLTVYYRSTDYTPDKNLRVTKVTRKRKTVTMDGSETMWIQSINDAGLVNAQFVVGNNGWPVIDVASFKCTHFEKDAKSIADAASEGVYVYYDGIYLRINKDRLESADKAGVSKWLAEKYAAGNPVTLTYQIATPEIYMTDRCILRKPDGLPDDATTTVTGTGETLVKYAHKLYHFIVDFVTKAISGNT